MASPLARLNSRRIPAVINGLAQAPDFAARVRDYLRAAEQARNEPRL